MIKVSGDKITASANLLLSALETEATNLLNRIELDILREMDNGTPQKAAEASTYAKIKAGSEFMREAENRLNRVVSEMENRLVAKPVQQYEQDNPKAKYHWILGEVKTEHCPDCSMMAEISEREGAKTIEEWRSYGVGLPREGKTTCNVGCKCMLLPEGKQ